MRAAAIGLGFLAWIAAGCGGNGSPRYEVLPDDVNRALEKFGSCAVCHEGNAVTMVVTGGHDDIQSCEVCHNDLLPGQVGPGHRAVPACESCHPNEATHHYPSLDSEALCTDCHTPHGSTNIFLVRELIVTPLGVAHDVTFNNEEGRADGSFASLTDPGTGICEICHTTTSVYRSDGTGAAHFTSTCVDCHAHADGFAVSISLNDCELCHAAIVTQADTTGGHAALDADCTACHSDLTPGNVGPGHRSIPLCKSCHSQEKTHHDPNIGTAAECTQCHTPHGSLNLALINEIISTPTNGPQPVEFNNQEGRADGSFASLTDPGTGICEICHTTTSVYRSDGTGAAHFTSTCVDCHSHADGFAVSISLNDCQLCHEAIVTQADTTGGHAALDADCTACHSDLTPGNVGPGHRSIPLCKSCHSQEKTHHDPNIDTAAECTQCHTPHGSPNLALINEIISTPTNGPQPVEFNNEEGRADGSFASLTDPGTGICEICHTTTSAYRSDGTGAAHFTSTCVDCHSHAAGFSVSISLNDCQLCHEAIVTQADTTGGHGPLDSSCQVCHSDLTPGNVGPGHRSIPLCKSCHSQEKTHHDPNVGTAAECTQCHTPHGSPNLSLVNEIIATPSGGADRVDFTNRNGRADGSFASLTDPGTGVCEICHTTTEFYRADGTSEEEHFVTRCTVCHTHQRGFSPSEDD